MKRSGPTHFKTERLMQGLVLARYEAVGILELLWHFADTHAPDGNLSRFRPADLAHAVGWSRPADELVQELVAAGFLDQPGCCENHTLLLHDRAEHAQEFVRKNVLGRKKAVFVEPCPGATGHAPDIWDQGRRTGEVSDSVEKKGGCSDSGFGKARDPPPVTPDPREVDQLALQLAGVLRIKHLDELKHGSPRWRQAKTDRAELAGQIAPAILAAGNGTEGWVMEQAAQSSTADRPMAAFKNRLKKQGVIKSTRKRGPSDQEKQPETTTDHRADQPPPGSSGGAARRGRVEGREVKKEAG